MRLVVSAAFTIALVLLQSTVLHAAAIQGVIPDLSLIAVIFIANRNGSVFGESAGFAGGIVEDFLSLSPLGFHALLKTIVGFFAGSTFGVIFIGSFFMPMLMAGAATILKYLLSAFLLAITNDPGTSGLFSLGTLIEIAYNMILAPFIFAFLNFFKVLVPRARG
ncbi:MAG: rod shape-determining protein MreD [Spirochaetales bacterium]|jgi:rod shape-determining protein MreD|nr:rod shape-determining protein MreD [Spirochaetales bacterium]